MSASARCHHPNVGFSIEPMAHPGDDLMHVSIAAKCDCCGTRFRFLGVAQNTDPMLPAQKGNGMSLLLPMVAVAA